MTEVSNSFSTGGLILASSVNQNFEDVVNLATAIGNEQIAGGITFDKLTQRNAPSWVGPLNIVPYTSDASFITPVGYEMPAAITRIKVFQPMVQPGWEAYVTGILVDVREADVVAGLSFALDFRRNATTVLMGQQFAFSTDDQLYLIANQDPISYPIATLGDGDFIEVRAWDNGNAAVRPRGVDVYFGMKHVLVR